VRRQVDFRESSRGIIKATLELMIVHARWLTLASLAIATALLLTTREVGDLDPVRPHHLPRHCELRAELTRALAYCSGWANRRTRSMW